MTPAMTIHLLKISSKLFTTKEVTLPAAVGIQSLYYKSTSQWIKNPCIQWYYSDVEVYLLGKMSVINFETELLFSKVSSVPYGSRWDAFYSNKMRQLCKRFSMISHIPMSQRDAATINQAESFYKGTVGQFLNTSDGS